MTFFLAANATSISAVLLGILSTVSTAVILVALGYGWKLFKRTLNEGRDAMVAQITENKTETQTQLDRIEAQTTKTNGRVADVVKDVETLKSDMRVEQAKTKLLTDIYLRLQPDKGE